MNTQHVYSLWQMSEPVVVVVYQIREKYEITAMFDMNIYTADKPPMVVSHYEHIY